MPAVPIDKVYRKSKHEASASVIFFEYNRFNLNFLFSKRTVFVNIDVQACFYISSRVHFFVVSCNSFSVSW